MKARELRFINGLLKELRKNEEEKEEAEEIQPIQEGGEEQN